MSIRFVHIADTHLGAGGFGNKLSENGINQREEDLCQAFTHAIDKIVELRPDFAIHAGDLFHTVRPTNRIINFAIQEILKLTGAGIPMVIISGNHDAPKQRSVGHVLSIFENLKDVYPVFRSSFEILRLGEVSLGCLPHCLTPEILQSQLEQVRPAETKFNILVAHGVVGGIDKFSMAELSEEALPSSVFQSGFDYVALGHYHKFTEVEPRVFYAGSTERLSFAELDEQKGFLEVTLPEMKVNFHAIPGREMIELERIDVKGMDYAQLTQRINLLLEGSQLSGKIVRLKIVNLSEALYANLPMSEIKAKTSTAFYLKLVTEKEGAVSLSLDEGVHFGRLLDEFKAFIGRRPLGTLRREELVNLAEKYFSEAEE